MKSLNDNYVSNHGSSNETFTDLMFCALVVLVLFVLALAIEVSQRVRAELAVEEPDVVPVVDASELATMTNEEIAELSKTLQTQANEINELRKKLDTNLAIVEKQKRAVVSQAAAMAGEQRFTGAREPAALNFAYDYRTDKFYFIPAREINHADRRMSGESNVEFTARKLKELVAIALKARTQRGFTLDEAKAIYQAFSTYKEVEANGESYEIVDSVVGIQYYDTLCAYIAGDTSASSSEEVLITAKLLEVYENPGTDSEEMYPRVVLEINDASEEIVINGVTLSPRDARELLLAIEGRGAMLDLEGVSGAAPDWLREKVLIPSGYISKTPKAPGR